MGSSQCTCKVATNDWAAVFTPAGLPAHVHGDGQVASGGQDGIIQVGNARWYAKKLIVEHGWIARGWKP
jgi:predicted carbohydrate-binding protein with CBM5 and CBM33 domain